MNHYSVLAKENAVSRITFQRESMGSIFMSRKNRPSGQAIIFAISVIMVVMALLFSCAGPRTARITAGQEIKEKPRISVAVLEKKVHELINKERGKQGLSPLLWDDGLAGIARGHSKDMAKRGFFSHSSPEGHDMTYRYRRAGYRCGIILGRTIYTGAENIAQNNLYDSVTTINGKAFYDWNSADRIAATTVEGWMNSPGHRKNILTPHWKNEGIGIFIAPDEKVYITQNFC